MKIIPSTYLEHLSYSSPPQSSNVTPDASSLEDVVVVHYSDSLESSTSSLSNDTGLFCSSTPLPTPLGIPRLFVSSSYRRRGIALHLLNCAAKTFIHGCPLDPKKGQIAFSQPSRAGRGVLEKWAGGNGRVYEE
jgi:N-acetyltransferase